MLQLLRKVRQLRGSSDWAGVSDLSEKPKVLVELCCPGQVYFPQHAGRASMLLRTLGQTL